MTTTQAPPSNTVSLTINGTKVTAPKGMLLVEAAKLAGVEVPVFCYHSRLKPVGACRMCLVEIEKMPRLQTACTTPVAEGMVAKTASDAAIAGQQAVVSMLLANHPLDCPVCDKGGECPLQDNTFKYGPGLSRFEEEKRHKDKAYELSDRIVLDKERCILCYRCVRFHEEIPGDRQLTVVDRGALGEIDVPEGSTYDSIFQGNVVDICPVGALTSRRYRFRARPWDLKRTPAVCSGCAVGCNVEAHARDGRVLRLVPRENPAINDVWLCDAGRWGTMPAERDARLPQPLLRTDAGLRPATWEEALRAAARLAQRPTTTVVVSPTLSTEALAVAGGALRFVLEGRGARFALAAGARTQWPVKGAIATVPASKSVVLVGLDVWNELPVLALPIRKAVQAGAKLTVVGADNGLSRDTATWMKDRRGEEARGLKDLVAAARNGGIPGPATLLAGAHVAADPAARALLEELAALIGADGGTGLVGAPAIASNAAGAALVMGDVPVVDAAALGDSDALVLLGDGSLDAAVAAAARARVVVVAAGLGADAAATLPGNVDVVLPLCHPYEQAGSLVNLEGRVQPTEAAGIPPPGARPDFTTLSLLCAELGFPMPVDVKPLRKKLAEAHPFFEAVHRASPRKELRLA